MSASFRPHGPHQTPLSMGFSRQEYWSGLPFPSPVDLSDPGIEPTFPILAGGFFTSETAYMCIYMYIYVYTYIWCLISFYVYITFYNLLFDFINYLYVLI